MKVKQVRYNYIELKKLKESLDKHLKDIRIELKIGEMKSNELKNRLKYNDEHEKNWVINVPKDFLKNLDYWNLINTGANNKPVQWKKIILKTFKTYKYPMSTNVLYDKIMQNYNLKHERRFVIKNISAALSSLYQNQEIVRTNLNNREKLYGLYEFLDEAGDFKKQLINNFKIENEGI